MSVSSEVDTSGTRGLSHRQDQYVWIRIVTSQDPTTSASQPPSLLVKELFSSVETSCAIGFVVKPSCRYDKFRLKWSERIIFVVGMVVVAVDVGVGVVGVVSGE